MRIRRGVKELEKTGSYPSEDVAQTHSNYVKQWENHPATTNTSFYGGGHARCGDLHNSRLHVPTHQEVRQLTGAPGFVQRAVRKQQEDEWLSLSFHGERKNQI